MKIMVYHKSKMRKLKLKYRFKIFLEGNGCFEPKYCTGLKPKFCQ